MKTLKILNTLLLTYILIPNVFGDSSLYIQKALKQNLYKKSLWHKLLHYKKGILGGIESNAKGNHFFLTKNGNKNPKEELEETIRNIFKENQKDDEHIICQFPARVRFLKNSLFIPEKDIPQANCPKLNKYKKIVNAKSATIVFSSFYLNTPASAFGHLLMRLNQFNTREKTSEKLDLLETGVSYAANIDGDNPIVYAIKGITGSYLGTFSIFPYYYKVREYNDYESRDLWEYDLNLTDKQVQRIVEHLWELDKAYFNYYYFSENCAYYLLVLLEIANPELKLINEVSYFAIPSEVTQIIGRQTINGKSLVKRIHYRPSARTKFFSRYNTTSSSNLTKFNKMNLNNPPLLDNSINYQDQIEILDLAIDYYDFKFAKELLNQDKITLQKKQEYLVSRSKIPYPSNEINLKPVPEKYPHRGHPPKKMTLSTGVSKNNFNKNNTFTELEYRLALHNLMDSSKGHINSEIEMGNIKIRYDYHHKNFNFEEFILFNVFSLSPFNQHEKHFSWRARTGMTTVRNDTCKTNQCHTYFGNFSSGPAMSFSNELFFGNAYFLFDTTTYFSSKQLKDRYKEDTWYQLNIGPLVGIQLSLSEHFIIHFKSSYEFSYPSYFKEMTYKFHSKYFLSKKWSINGHMNIFKRSKEFLIGTSIYL